MKDIPISTLLKYYKRADVQNAIVKAAKNKEIAVVYGSKGYGKRPDTLKYPNDVLTLAKNGATSFHCSEELWSNPLQLHPGLSKTDMEELRTGWDLVLDIDCKWLEYSKIAGHYLIEAIKHHGIKTVSVKFSGNHGFHIAVPFSAFPEQVQNKETKNLFPEAPRKIAAHLKTMITPHLAKEIMKLEGNNWENIKQKTGLCDKEIKLSESELNVDAILEIDTILISPRHLYRMPYSFNEKSGRISTPIKPEEILQFDKTSALPENVKVDMDFMDCKNLQPNEAKKLLIAAFDSELEKKEIINEKLIKKPQQEFIGPALAVPAQYFPPCINNILKGLQDGKKRSLFAIINFLSSCAWTYEEMEKLLEEWNKKNPEPLREVYLKGQLRYWKQQNKKILPPNCANAQYYSDLHICTPDNFCKKIKNPANYALLKQKIIASENEKNSSKKTQEKEQKIAKDNQSE